MKKVSEEHIAALAEILEALDWEMVFLSHQDQGDDLIEIDGRPVGGMVIGSTAFIKEVVPKVSDLSADDIEEAFQLAEQSEDGTVDFDEIKRSKVASEVSSESPKAHLKKKTDPTFH